MSLGEWSDDSPAVAEHRSARDNVSFRGLKESVLSQVVKANSGLIQNRPLCSRFNPSGF